MRIEQGTRLISDLELLALAAALERDPAWLLLGDATEISTSSNGISDMFRDS